LLFQDNELTATSDKKVGRQDLELRNKRLRRRLSSSSDDDNAQQKNSSSTGRSSDDVGANKSAGSEDRKDQNYEAHKGQTGDQAKRSNGSEMSSKEILEAAARAQLRSKFDHVGIDPHSSSAVDRGVPGIPNRGMTSSPPPPGLANGAALSPHGAVSGFARHVGEHSPGSGESSSDSVPHPSTVQQNPMPFFSAANENATHIPAMHANQGIQMLQMHHAEALLGAPANNPPLDLVVGPDGGGTSSGAAGGDSALSSANVANLDVSDHLGREMFSWHWLSA